jgi:transposase-like protein
MVQRHPSTPQERAQWIAQMLAHANDYGFVTHLSRTIGVSRQTLYTWTEQGRRALEQAFTAAPPAALVTPSVERHILTLLVESHPSYRGIQTCLRRLTQQQISLGTIAAVIADAQHRALNWCATHAPPTARPIALDEIYGNQRGRAYLSIVDTASYAVWAAEGPLPVDAETWTLLLWLAQDRGLHWYATTSDGGAAIHAACRVVEPEGVHGRDIWHVFRRCAQVQERLDRRVSQLQRQATTVERQAARLAAGQRPRGPKPNTDVAAHQAKLAQASRSAESVRYLTQVLRELLEVVVITPAGVLDGAGRRAELDALVTLLAEVRDLAPTTQHQEIKRLHTHLLEALPDLLAFVAQVDAVQQDMAVVLGREGVALVAWAWQRRAILGTDLNDLLALLPEAWRAPAHVLMSAWEQAVRASSAVENWHSILRPHLAVHRTLSAGMLALLAVWHNHRVFPRGVHQGQSPLQLSGMADAPTDWLVALGYPPADVSEHDTPVTASAPRRALAA